MKGFDGGLRYLRYNPINDVANEIQESAATHMSWRVDNRLQKMFLLDALGLRSGVLFALVEHATAL